MELFELNLRDAAEGVRTKKFSALELFDACFARAVSCEPKLAALITLTEEEGRRRAAEIDARIARGEDDYEIGRASCRERV